MATKKNQHFVPQVYLRNFSLDGASIGVYVRHKDIWVESAPIKKQSCADYFYGKDLKLENLLGNLEYDSSRIFEKLTSPDFQSLNPQELSLLFFYISLQWGRTEFAANQMLNMSRDFQKKTQELFPGCEVPKLKVSETLLSSVEFSVALAVELSSSINDLHIKYLYNTSGLDFITSDNPVCLYNQFCERIGKPSFAFGSIGAQIFFPISPKIMVLIYDDKCYKVGHRKETIIQLSKREDIITLNNIVCINANKVLYFLRKDKISIPRKYLDYTHEEIPLQSVNQLIYCSNRPPLCKAKIPCIKEIHPYKYIQSYDYSMGGLLRPSQMEIRRPL